MNCLEQAHYEMEQDREIDAEAQAESDLITAEESETDR